MPGARGVPVMAVAAVGGLACVSLLPPLARRLPIREGEEWPARAVNRIEELGLSGRFFGRRRRLSATTSVCG